MTLSTARPWPSDPNQRVNFHLPPPLQRRFGRHLRVALLIGFVLATASAAAAQTTPVTATWDANTEPNIAGYVLSSGTQPGIYSTSVDVGNVMNWQGPLNMGVRYYFAVKAYNTSLQFSPNSVEVVFDVPATVLPIISGVSASTITTSSASISWTTNVPTTSQVDYGPSASYGSSIVDPALLSLHSMSLASLSAGTPYFFQVKGADAAGHAAAASGYTFVTATTVPNVVNMTQSNATNALAAAHVTVGTVTTATSATVPSGSVISQNPAAGIVVTSGTRVALVVSSGSGSQLTPMPNVVGMTQANATNTLVAGGMRLGAVTNAASSIVPAGSVISQNPAAGTLVAPRTADAIVVSSGSVLVVLPNIVGMTQSNATNALVAAGVKLGAVTTAASLTVPAGSVISQNPVAGTLVAPGSADAIVVSSGLATAPTVDKIVVANGSGSWTTPYFSTSAAGEVLVAFVASDGPTWAPQTVTVSGAGLTWVLVNRANTQLGTAEVWKATAASLLTNVRVRSTQNSGAYHQSLTVVAFAGAGTVGASVSAGASTGTPSASLWTTKAASLVYGVGNDWDQAIARTPGTNQRLVHQWVDTTVGDTFWVQALTSPIASAGTLAQLNDLAPATDQWNLVVVEIRAK
jgi:beta-lactam-binding protein with PASTA domain